MIGLENFGGIFRLKQLQNVKIVSLPISLIILTDEHWISIYITDKTVEIMDSAGFINAVYIPKMLKRFLRVHINNKDLTITPKLQSDTSSACALYATTFLYFRTVTGKSLCEFCKIFTSDKSINCAIIKELFNEIWKK